MREDKQMKKLLAAVCLMVLAMSLPVLAEAAGDVTLEGTVGTRAPQVISVTMPYRVLFSVQTDGEGKVTEGGVIGATAPVINGSNCAVKLQITRVADPGGLLGKLDLALAAERVGADAALQSGKLISGGGLSIDFLTLARGARETVTVFGRPVDPNTVIETGSYTVTPTITVTAAP